MEINMNKINTLCFTGHRPQSLPWGYDETKSSCESFKKELMQILVNAIEYGITTFLTGMAEGFDMIAGEMVLKLKEKYSQIKLVAVIPCLGQEKRWNSNQQKRYKKILEQCDDKIVLSDTFTPNCMNERNKYMVENSGFCIACYIGKPSGTRNTIRFAKECGCKVKIINPEKFI